MSGESPLARALRLRSDYGVLEDQNAAAGNRRQLSGDPLMQRTRGVLLIDLVSMAVENFGQSDQHRP